MKIVILSLIILTSCNHEPNSQQSTLTTTVVESLEGDDSLIHPSGKYINTRFSPPKDYIRKNASNGSFGHFLQTFTLRPHGAKVRYFDGTIKENRKVYDAVVDLKIGQKNLHQCADALMHLRARYLLNNSQEEEIAFNFTNGFTAAYKKWSDGHRIKVNGNNVTWYKAEGKENNEQTFWAYMEQVFMYAGTASLEKELKSIPISQMEIGDIFIQGGYPGHAVIVVDMAQNKSGQKLFMLAQSYMPAQEIQILVNPNDEGISPWYHLMEGTSLTTPEWTFSSTDLKRF